jgi:hypothetical protein
MAYFGKSNYRSEQPDWKQGPSIIIVSQLYWCVQLETEDVLISGNLWIVIRFLSPGICIDSTGLWIGCGYEFCTTVACLGTLVPKPDHYVSVGGKSRNTSIGMCH